MSDLPPTEHPLDPSDLDRLHAVEDVVHRLASDLASAKADQLRALRELEGLAGRVEAGQHHQADLAERLERLAAQLVALGRLDALDRRLEALQTSHEATDERLNRLQSAQDQIGQLERRMADQGETLTHLVEAQRENLLEELERGQRRRTEEFGQVTQDVQALVARLEPLEALAAPVTALDRRVNSLMARIDQVDQRIEAQGAEILRFQAQHQAHEERLRAAHATSQAAIAELGVALAALDERVGEQTGVMQDARTFADELRRQDDERRTQFRALADAERIFEARVEGLHQDLVRDVTARFEALDIVRAREWEDRHKLLAEGEAALRDELQTAHREASEALSRHLDALGAKLEVQADDIAALRRLLGRAAEGWFGVSSDLAAGVGTALGGAAEEADPLDRRRQALAERVAAAKQVRPS